jgi:hypothetical protein
VSVQSDGHKPVATSQCGVPLVECQTVWQHGPTGPCVTQVSFKELIQWSLARKLLLRGHWAVILGSQCQMCVENWVN